MLASISCTNRSTKTTQRSSPDLGFRLALKGVTQVRTLDTNARSVNGVERPLLRRFGALLVVDQGVALTRDGPILAVVVSYARLEPTRRQAAADSRSIIFILAVGLLVFWLRQAVALCIQRTDSAGCP